MIIKTIVMKFICIAALALLFCACHPKMAAHISTTGTAQSFLDGSGNPMLLGIHHKQDLQQAPYADWFNKNYTSYTVDTVAAGQLKPLLKDKHVEIFMGTWCGDSQREVPRMLKILEYAGVQPVQIKLVMVSNHDSSYKQSPGHEEKGKNIHRVPDLLLFDADKEINRIIESPVVSLEKDLLSISSNNDYQPNYRGAHYLAGVSMSNDLAILIRDTIALSQKLKPITANSRELNSLGYVWKLAGEMDKALLAFQLNAMLFPADANVYASLGEITMKMGKKDEARKYYRQLLVMQPANEHAAKMLLQLQ
jgi:tetratricopeptide (TPR) repeat protein